MIDPKILKMLDSSNVSDRKQAVKELARSRSREALKYLAALHKTESDPEVRDLALKAGRYIKQQLEAEAPVFSSYGSDDDEEDEYGYDDDEDAAPPAAPADVHVSDRDRERSMTLVEQALELSMRDEQEKAIKSLRQAFKLNPLLPNDSYAMGIITEVVALPKSEAVRYLTGDAKEEKRKERSKRGGDDEEVTWGVVIVDILIYWLVTAGSLSVLSIILVQLVLQPLRDMVARGEYVNPALDPVQLLTFISTIGIIFVLIYAVLYTVFQFIIQLFQWGFIHLSAVMILSGEGSFKELIHKTALYLAFTTAGLFLLSFGLVFISIQSVTANPNLPPDPSLDCLSGIINLGASFIVLVWYGKLIGSAYRFGMGRGCVSLIIATVMLMVMFACFAFALISMVGPIFDISSMITPVPGRDF